MLPETSWSIVYAIILFVAISTSLYYGARDGRIIAGVMLCNWIGTRLVVATGASLLFTGFTDFLSSIALLVFCSTKPAITVAALFVGMMALYSTNIIQFSNLAQMWACVDLLAYLQIILMLWQALVEDRNCRASRT